MGFLGGGGGGKCRFYFYGREDFLNGLCIFEISRAKRISKELRVKLVIFAKHLFRIISHEQYSCVRGYLPSTPGTATRKGALNFGLILTALPLALNTANSV